MGLDGAIPTYLLKQYPQWKAMHRTHMPADSPVTTGPAGLVMADDIMQRLTSTRSCGLRLGYDHAQRPLFAPVDYYRALMYPLTQISQKHAKLARIYLVFDKPQHMAELKVQVQHERRANRERAEKRKEARRQCKIAEAQTQARSRKRKLPAVDEHSDLIPLGPYSAGQQTEVTMTGEETLWIEPAHPVAPLAVVDPPIIPDASTCVDLHLTDQGWADANGPVGPPGINMCRVMLGGGRAYVFDYLARSILRDTQLCPQAEIVLDGAYSDGVPLLRPALNKATSEQWVRRPDLAVPAGEGEIAAVVHVLRHRLTHGCWLWSGDSDMLVLALLHAGSFAWPLWVRLKTDFWWRIDAWATALGTSRWGVRGFAWTLILNGTDFVLRKFLWPGLNKTKLFDASAAFFRQSAVARALHTGRRQEILLPWSSVDAASCFVRCVLQYQPPRRREVSNKIRRTRIQNRRTAMKQACANWRYWTSLQEQVVPPRDPLAPKVNLEEDGDESPDLCAPRRNSLLASCAVVSQRMHRRRRTHYLYLTSQRLIDMRGSGGYGQKRTWPSLLGAWLDAELLATGWRAIYHTN